MKTLTIAMLALLCLGAPSWAQEKTDAAQAVTLGPSTTSTNETCVEVEIGGEKASPLDCINHQLKRQVDRVQPTGNVAPLDATSPSVKVGGFNEAGMSQQYGQNWGKSVTPFRPAPPVYASPVGRHP